MDHEHHSLTRKQAIFNLNTLNAVKHFLKSRQKKYIDGCKKLNMTPSDHVLEAFGPPNGKKACLFPTLILEDFEYLISRQEACLNESTRNILSSYPSYITHESTYSTVFVYASKLAHRRGEQFLYTFIAPDLPSPLRRTTSEMVKSDFVHASIACIRETVEFNAVSREDVPTLNKDGKINIAYFSKLLAAIYGVHKDTVRNWYNSRDLPHEAEQKLQLVDFQQCSQSEKFGRLKKALITPVRIYPLC